MKGCALALDRSRRILAALALALAALGGLYAVAEVVDLDDYVGLSSLGGLISAIPSYAASVVQVGGWPAVFGLMALESASLPIPSEVVLPLAGYLAYVGKMDPIAAFLAALAGSMVGSYVDYYVGRALGMEVLKRKAWVSAEALNRAEGWFRRYGEPMVIVTRFLPGARTIVSFPAGALGMSWRKFGAYTLAGSAIWSAALIAMGYYLGSNWGYAVELANRLLLPISIAAIAGISIYFLIYVARRSARDSADGLTHR